MVKNYSPSTPTSSTSTRENTTMDGTTDDSEDRIDAALEDVASSLSDAWYDAAMEAVDGPPRHVDAANIARSVLADHGIQLVADHGSVAMRPVVPSGAHPDAVSPVVSPAVGGPVELDLGPIEARLEAATPGPWEADGNGVHTRRGACVALTHFADHQRVDAEFIAHAPTDVRALVAEVRRLRGQVQRARAIQQRLHDGDTVGVIRQSLADELDAALDAEAVTE